MYRERVRRKEIPDEKLTFIMVTGDGGMDIGLGSAIATAIRNHHGIIIFEYDNGGYMNTGYQLSYSTPKGAASSTSHVGKAQYGKTFFPKDTLQIMAATKLLCCYLCGSHPADLFAKQQLLNIMPKLWHCIFEFVGLSLNWRDKPQLKEGHLRWQLKLITFHYMR